MYKKAFYWLREKAPLPAFIISITLTAFIAGMVVQQQEIFPSNVLSAVQKTTSNLIESPEEKSLKGPLPIWSKFVDIPPESVASHRIRFISGGKLIDPVLFPGGKEHFAEYCPGYTGCLAVEYAGQGKVVHAYPYRLNELADTNPIVYFPKEKLPTFSFSKHVDISGVAQYPNGDLLVVMHTGNTFPYSGGSARINRAGQIVWYRDDSSHHIPYLVDGDVALVPGFRIGEGRHYVSPNKPLAEAGLPSMGHVNKFTMKCTEKYYRDNIRIIDGEGKMLEEIPVFDALLESPYALTLLNVRNPCNPIHLNFAHVLQEDTTEIDGGKPGDLVVSLRNLNAFGIIDRSNYRLKRFIRGSFFAQHSVMHLEGSKFLMLDNLGGRKYDASRLLMVDLKDGRETTIFPSDTTPEPIKNLFTIKGGHISISPDRKRVIITFSIDGKAVEVHIADGEILTEFTSVHNASHIEHYPEERKTRAVRHVLQGMYYLDRNGK